MAEFIINKTLRVVSQFTNDSDTNYDTNAMVISYALFYPNESNTALISGTLSGINRQPISCLTANGFIIDGDFVTQLNTGEIVLRANLFYGFNNNTALQNHFEGTIAIYPLVQPPLPPSPPDPPLPPEEYEGEFTGNITIDVPLFPYIYIKPWPKETATDTWLYFINYEPDNAPASSLYNLLIAPSGEKNRAAMETLALQFLQNEAPFINQYFYDLSTVPKPFELFPAIYDLLSVPGNANIYEELILGQSGYETVEQMRDFLSSTGNQVIDQLWQNYFALTIITGYNESFFVDINKILLVWNILEKWQNEQPYSILPFTSHSIQVLLRATIVLPGIPDKGTVPVFPLPPYQASGPIASNNRIEPYAIGQLKMTRYRLLRYQQGEMAQIQNILKGEKKKTVNRTFSNTAEKNTLQNNNHNENSSEYYETTGELQVEAQKTIAALTKTVKYDKLTSTYGPPTQAILDGSYVKSITAGDPSKENASHFTSLVLDKTLNRINEAVLQSRTFSKYHEKEQMSSSTFNNAAGTLNFRAIYRWVNKVYRISVHNYGYRFLLELHIDNPAAGFIASQEKLNNINFSRPLSLRDQKINSFKDITTENYVALVSYYRAKIILPPEPVTSLSVTLSANDTEKIITIPQGYAAGDAVIMGQIAIGSAPTTITGIVGSVAFSISDSTGETKVLNKETGQICIAVMSNNIIPGSPIVPGNFILNATINCNVTDRKMSEWTSVIYKEINEAYEKMIIEYNDSITRFAMEGHQTNPLLVNNIEKSCLYQSCVDMLLDIANNKTGQAPDIKPFIFSVNRQRYSQFIEEAFEWNEMAYSFNGHSTNLNYALQGKDDSLRPFLQASSATIFLPARPDYNFSMLYFLSSGIISVPGYTFVPVNSTDIETSAHLHKIHDWNRDGKEERSWEITLPTDMQVVQETSQLPDYSI